MVANNYKTPGPKSLNYWSVFRSLVLVLFQEVVFMHPLSYVIYKIYLVDLILASILHSTRQKVYIPSQFWSQYNLVEIWLSVLVLLWSPQRCIFYSDKTSLILCKALCIFCHGKLDLDQAHVRLCTDISC